MPESATSNGHLDEDSDQNATLRTLNAFAVDLISIPNEEDLFWYVAQNVVGQLKFVDCVIYQANEAQTKLSQVAALGEKNPFGRSIVNPLEIPFGHGITGKAAQTREAIIIDDLRMDDSYIQDTQQARSEICVPLICGNRVVGVIDSEHPKPNAFGPAELEVLITISAMTSAKLDLLSEAKRSSQRYHDLVAAHAQLSSETSNRKALEAELSNTKKRQAVGQLTGRFAHEFNNLLTVISGNLEFLEADIGHEPFADTLRAAQTAAARGSGLIQSMLAYSQRTHLSPQIASLNAIVTQHVAKNAPPPAHQVALDLDPDLKHINVDQQILDTVLLNLISNACDAMPDGGKVRISTQNITHSLIDEQPLVTPLMVGNYVRLSVQDSGIGISHDALQQVFDPFYTTKPVGNGTGLGLSMTLGFMQQSGGTVAVESVAGQGSVFHLYFPAVEGDEYKLLTKSH